MFYFFCYSRQARCVSEVLKINEFDERVKVIVYQEKSGGEWNAVKEKKIEM